MKLGVYNKKPIDFDKYKMSKVRLSFFNGPYDNFFGCGPCAASLLTDTHPKSINKLNKNKDHFSDKRMVDFLRYKGFTVKELTVGELSNCDVPENKITKNHLILVSQMYAKQEASWVVIKNGNILYHNFISEPLNPLEFVVRPILTAYLLYKEEWK